MKLDCRCVKKGPFVVRLTSWTFISLIFLDLEIRM